MSDPVRGEDTPAKRGRFEIRTILLIVVAVIVLGAIVSVVFGPQGDGSSSVEDPAATVLAPQ